jgi:UDP-N-acetylmuramoyl-tripeptide--D-alanyl-D-alanine ligase
MNVNPVHAMNFPSIEAIADEKCSLVRGMTAESTVVYNADDPLIKKRLKDRAKIFTYGFSAKVDLRITDVRMRGVKGSSAVLVSHARQIPVETILCGFGNLYNIAAAVSVALTLGIPVIDIALEVTKLKPFHQRGILIQRNEIDIYDDTYNSNPKALEMILKMAGESTGYKRKIGILGDMLELGEEEVKFHQKAGEQVGNNGFDILITAGPLSKHMKEEAEKRGTYVVVTENSEEAAEKAAEIVATRTSRPPLAFADETSALHQGDLVIVKGSRGMKMENVVRRLQEQE